MSMILDIIPSANIKRILVQFMNYKNGFGLFFVHSLLMCLILKLLNWTFYLILLNATIVFLRNRLEFLSILSLLYIDNFQTLKSCF